MSRATYGAARHRKKMRWLKAAKGYHTALSVRWRLAREAVVRAGVNAFRDRRRRKREFRAMWITRLTASCRSLGIRYSRLIYGLNAAHIELNRKMLSEMAIYSPADFEAVVNVAKKHAPPQADAA